MAIPKFYLFDVGIANYLSKTRINDLKGTAAGKAFEHYIAMELVAYRELKGNNFSITYWRTKTNLEVDFIIGESRVAIEAKITVNVSLSEIRGLKAFQEEHKVRKAYVVCLAPKARKIKFENGQEILILPWEKFLKMLWADEITEDA